MRPRLRTTLTLATLTLAVGPHAAPAAAATPLTAPTGRVLASAAAAPAHGAAVAATPTDTCDALLLDTAGVLSAAQAERVSDTARSLRSETAYEIRVRILTQEQAPSLDAWMDAQEAACSSWRAADGGFRNNLVVLAFTTDSPTQTGETGLYYGAQMPSTMDDQWPRVLADEINPAIRDGDWERGVTAGLTAVGKVLDPPSIFSWKLLVVAAGLVAVVLGLVGGNVAVRRRRRRRHLAERFTAATTRFDELTLPLDDALQLLRRDTELLREAVCDEEVSRAVEPAERLLQEGDQILHQRSELSTGRDRVLDGRDLDAIERAVSAWETLTSSADTLARKLSAEQRRLAGLIDRVQTLREHVGAVPALAEKVTVAADAGERDGFVVTTERSVLDTVDERLAEIDRLADERRLLSADERLTALVDDLTSAHDQLTSLRQRRAALTERARQLQEAARELSDLAEDAAKALEELRTGYAPGVWSDLAAHIDAGHDRLTSAGERATAVDAALAAGDLSAGERHAEAVEENQREAGESFTAVVERLEGARELSRTVPHRHADVGARLARLRKVVSSPDVGVSHREKAATLEAELAAVDVQAAQPDWILLDRLLTDLSARVDAAMREATAARAKAERRRREEVRSAAAQVARRATGRTTGTSFSTRRSGGTSRRGGSRPSTGRRGGSRSRGSSGGRRGGSARR